MADYKLFTEKYEEEIKKFAFFSKIKDTEQYLIDHPHLGTMYSRSTST